MGEREGEREGEESRGEERNEPVYLYMEAKNQFWISSSVALLIFEAGSLTVSDLVISTRRAGLVAPGVFLSLSPALFWNCMCVSRLCFYVSAEDVSA